MMPNFIVYGDIDRDSNNEAVVIVLETGGGAGVFRVIALFGRAGEDARHLGSIVLGDRVQVRSIQIQPGQLTAEYVRQAENDPRCCPTEIARTSWTYAAGKFSVASDAVLGKLSPAFLAGTNWELQPPTKPVITLTFADGRFSGEAGCNHYDAPAKEGQYGGSIAIGRAATTRRACDTPVMQAEQDFLRRLQKATRMGFLPGRLWMSYDLGGNDENGTLEFKEASKTTSSPP
jgi:heat shock protein HslJ